MELPDKNEKVWQGLLDGSINIRFDVMAVNLLIFNQKCRVQKDPSCMGDAMEKIHDFFEESIDIPKVQQAVDSLAAYQ